jgi:hypothetical protein
MNVGKTISALILLIPIVGTVWAKLPDPCPDKCRMALEALIAAGSQSVPAGSSCDDVYSDEGRPTIAKNLASELSRRFKSEVQQGSIDGMAE